VCATEKRFASEFVGAIAFGIRGKILFVYLFGMRGCRLT
jgi:hypothetical protein